MTPKIPTSAPIVSCEFTLTPVEMSDFYRASRRRASQAELAGLKWLQWAAAFVAVLAAGAAGYVLAPGAVSRAEASGVALLGGAVTFIVALILLWTIEAARRMPASWADAGTMAREVALHTEGVAMNTAITRSFLPWSQVSLIRLYDRLMIVWPGFAGGIPLPASAVGGRDKLREVHARALDLWHAARMSDGGGMPTADHGGH